MGLRNFVLNETVWNYLTGNFEIDLVTSVAISDPQELGLHRVYDTSSIRGFRRVMRQLALRVVSRFQLIGYVQFYRTGQDPDTLALKLNQAEHDGSENSLLRWSSLAGTPLERPIRGLVSFLSGFVHPKPLDREEYRLVVLGHTFVAEAAAYGIAANRAGIPVICTTLGVDNLLNPIAFNPSLILAWGPEEKRVFNDYHVRSRPSLAGVPCVAAGCLMYDYYSSEATKTEATSAAKTRDEGASPVILIPASVNALFPWQIAMCELLIDILQQNDVSGTLLVRMRPGVDLEIWKQFAARHRDRVTLQVPVAASFDKRDSERSYVVDGASGPQPTAANAFNLESEKAEASAFVKTVTGASLIVVPSLSTMVVDGMALGTPVIVVPVDITSDNPLESRQDPMFIWYQGRAARQAGWDSVQAPTSQTEFEAMVLKVLVEGAGEEFVSRLHVEHEATANDGHVGDRWVGAVEKLLGTDPDR